MSKKFTRFFTDHRAYVIQWKYGTFYKLGAFAKLQLFFYVPILANILIVKIKFQCSYSVTIEHSVAVSVTERNSIVLHTRMRGIGTNPEKSVILGGYGKSQKIKEGSYMTTGNRQQHLILSSSNKVAIAVTMQEVVAIT